MDLDLAYRVILVTGASAGIGRATVELLAAEGAHVVGAPRTPKGLDAPRMTAVSADLSTPDGPEELVQAALDRHDRRSRQQCRWCHRTRRVSRDRRRSLARPSR